MPLAAVKGSCAWVSSRRARFGGRPGPLLGGAAGDGALFGGAFLGGAAGDGARFGAAADGALFGGAALVSPAREEEAFVRGTG